jgi:trigger factor
VATAIDRLADGRKTYTPKPEGSKAENGDRLTVDFVGKIDGKEFEGGTSKDIDVVLGTNTFIPGFEEQLLGAVAGEKRTIEATFPENYADRKLAGRTSTMDVDVKAVAAPDAFAIDDEFAKSLNFESLDKVKEAVQGNITAEYARASRDKLKRRLLDALDKRYSFELPEGLVNQEFESIWRQVEAEQQASGRGFADENTTEEAARADYRRIAERRVRLGLLLAEVGAKADVKISDEELTNALIARARSFPGQEKQVWEFYRKNPQAMAELRAPLYEERVVDHIISLAKVTDKPVTREELLRADEDDASVAPAGN